jgi:hypothetical protein
MHFSVHVGSVHQMKEVLGTMGADAKEGANGGGNKEQALVRAAHAAAEQAANMMPLPFEIVLGGLTAPSLATIDPDLYNY